MLDVRHSHGFVQLTLQQGDPMLKIPECLSGEVIPTMTKAPALTYPQSDMLLSGKAVVNCRRFYTTFF